MRAKIINLVVFNIAWFACILGAAWGIPWLGVAVVALSVGGHLLYASFDRGLAVLFVLAFVIGWGFDALVVVVGALDFPPHALLLAPVPLWMPCMWVSLATTLHLSLGWMRGRWLVAMLFGLLGGPGAYYTGMKLGAVTLGDDLMRSLLIVGIEWGVAMPVLVWLATLLLPIKTRRTASPKAPSAMPTQGVHS